MTFTKYFIPFIVLSVVLASCGSGSGEQAEIATEKPGHTISGTMQGAEGEKVRLMVFEQGKEKFIDSCLIVDGKYSLHTTTNELRQYIMFVGNYTPIVLFLDEASEKNVDVSASVPDIGENYTVTGSTISNDLREYMLFAMQDYDREISLLNQLNTINPADTKQTDAIYASLDSIFVVQRQYAVDHITKDSASPVSWMMLRELVPHKGVLAMDSSDLNYFQMVVNGMKAKYPYTEYVTYIENDIASINAQFAQQNAPASQAPEIKLPDVNGKELALSSLRGKYVLLDFWASWCGPCRMENPNVVRMYEKYKDKGFTVFSVSLDEDKEAWKKAIQADNLSWPNHVSDLNGWASAPVATYGVQGIPATFLLDKEGNIIAQNLRGAQLEQKLQELLD